MRIVLDGRAIHDHFPGIGRYAYHLAAALPAALRDAIPEAELVLVHAPGQPNTRYDLGALAAQGVRLAACDAPSFALAAQWRVPRALRRLGAGLYHSPFYIMPYRPGPATVLTLFDLIPLVEPRSFSARTRLLFRLTARLAAGASRRIIALSRSAAADVVQHLGLPAGRVVTIPAAAGPEFTPQPATAVAALRARLGLPDRYLLYFGSNKPHKNLPRLVRACLSLPAAPPLVIAGHWDARFPEARAAAEQAAPGRVLFVGPVGEADLPMLYSGAALFVFPSLFEGFGLPPLEAMACGAPVAVSAVSSLPEVVGEAGLYFDPRDEAAIARTLAAALDDPARLAELRQRGQQRARAFTWEAAAQQTARVYAEALGMTQ